MRIRLPENWKGVSADTPAYQPKEKEIQDAIRDYLNLCGAVVVRINSGGMPATMRNGRQGFLKFNDTPGVSDLVVCLDGRFIAIEVKRPRGSKATPDQIAFLDTIRNAGGLGFIARSVDDVRDALKLEGFDVP